MLLCDLVMHAEWLQSEHEKVFLYLDVSASLHSFVTKLHKVLSQQCLQVLSCLPFVPSYFQMAVVLHNDQALSADS